MSAIPIRPAYKRFDPGQDLLLLSRSVNIASIQPQQPTATRDFDEPITAPQISRGQCAEENTQVRFKQTLQRDYVRGRYRPAGSHKTIKSLGTVNVDEIRRTVVYELDTGLQIPFSAAKENAWYARLPEYEVRDPILLELVIPIPWRKRRNLNLHVWRPHEVFQ
jgi:hypothetical protein